MNWEKIKTTLGIKSSQNQIVNLEPALRISDRLGGHIVTGHIDGVAQLLNIKKIDKSQKEFLKLMEDNNVICVSPPGHGKTSTAIQSISYYLNFSNYTKPKNIFFLSFTNAAINEARNRLKDVNGGRLVECYTIDSFAGRLNQKVREDTGLKFQTNTYEENIIQYEFWYSFLAILFLFATINGVLRYFNFVNNYGFKPNIRGLMFPLIGLILVALKLITT